MGRIALIIGAFLLYTKLSAAAGLSDIAKNFKILLTGVNLKKSSGNLFSTTLYPKIEIDNPTTSSGKIDSITGELFLNDSSVGTYSVRDLKVNPGKSVFEIPVSLNNINLLAFIVGAMTNGTEKGGLNYKITGTVTTGPISATFSEKFTVITPRTQAV